MKIIEGLKQLKELSAKAEDLRAKIAVHSAKVSFETDVYPDQAGQVSQWLQAHSDLVVHIERLHLRIALTNLCTMVTIDIGGNNVTKSITAWILRRRQLAELEKKAWASLTDRGLKEGPVRAHPDSPITEVKIVRFYDPKRRDSMINTYTHEPALIDRRLEVVNAVTDLLSDPESCPRSAPAA